MGSHSRPFPSDISEDEENHFTRYMDENGIIGLEEEEGLELSNQDVLELEDDEQKMLGGEEMVELYEAGLSYPQSPMEGGGSGMPTWKEELSFSQMAEDSILNLGDTETFRNSDIILNGDTDDQSSVEHPSKSVTLPSMLNRSPPSRDYQLDMTEDEVDRGSSLGTWDEEEGNWNEGQLDLLIDGSPSHGRLGNYDQTSPQEGQWDNNPGSPEESSNQDNQEQVVVRESLSTSSPPIPSTWGTRLMTHFSKLNLSPQIEDETLPESSCTDSGENPAAIPSVDPTEVSNHGKVSKQNKTLGTKPVRPPSGSHRTQRAESLHLKKTKRSKIHMYGKRQLNYPLPDFSKVGPRVRFPRDEEGYQPPQPRRVENPKQSAPVIFKSPAEIVREVLLSSTEKPNQEPVVAPTVPKEFKTPQQATELVHQLQEDYHKLLTKYAEAENTIDRLRLGAKVHLYSDPPQPSHSVQMGTINHGTKVMEFTIPHIQTATLTSASEHHGITEVDSESLPLAPAAMAPSTTSYPDTSGLSPDLPGEDVASTLMPHLETVNREVELFKELLRDGNLTPEEQRQAVRELRGSLDVLERRYLKAQEQYKQEQRRTGTGHPPMELDPQRELEEIIFQLGVQLEELQEKVLNSGQPPPSNQSEDTVTAHHLGNAPVPSAVVPIPALKTPYPQVSSPEPPRLPGADVGAVIKEDPAEYLPQPIRYKHMQLERDYGTLLSRYSSFKSLPDSLGVEQDEWPQWLPQNARPHDQDDQAQDVSTPEKRQPDRSQDQAQTTRTVLDPMPSGRTQGRQEHLQTVSPRGQQESPKTKWHSQIAKQQGRTKSVTPGSHRPIRSSMDSLRDSRPNSGASVHPTPSSPELSRTHSVSSGPRTAPDEGRYSAVRRSSHGSETLPYHASRRSTLPQTKAHSSSTPKGTLSFSNDTTLEPQSPQSRKQGSSKSVSPSAQKESPRMKGGAGQRRILSPETDSGFLGSESGRSFLLQKQREQLNVIRNHPEEFPESSGNSPLKSDRRPTKAGSGHSSRTHKPSWEKRKQNGRWTGLSEASSPSPGPKSLTDSESRERSETDETDSEQEAFHEVTGDPSSGLSPILSPTVDLSQSNVLEARLARDQAIHSLKKEVTQLRQHLENSLNQSPKRGILGHQSLQDGKVPDFGAGLSTPLSRRGSAQKEPQDKHMTGSSLSRDHDPSRQEEQVERGVRGPYTGSRYQLTGSPSHKPTARVTVPHCVKCQHTERHSHESNNTREDDSALPLHAGCPLCHETNELHNTARAGMSHGHCNKCHHCRHRRCPHCRHRLVSHTSPVTYVQPPRVHYSPPVIYGTSPSFYVPVGYNASDPRPSYAATSPSKADVLQLEDLSWPLNRALEAAKELKVTSRRMCQSLTLDLGVHRHLRSSCLF